MRASNRTSKLATQPNRRAPPDSNSPSPPPDRDVNTVPMASIIARRAFTTSARRLATGEQALKSESKKNPEIMVRQIPTANPRHSAQQRLDPRTLRAGDRRSWPCFLTGELD